MGRATRVEFPGAICHPMGPAMPGAKASSRDGNRERFLQPVGQLVESGDVNVDAYGRTTTRSRSAVAKSVLRVDEIVRNDPVVARDLPSLRPGAPARGPYLV